MAGNKSLNAAARTRNDEFYTQLPDIENELRHYREHFKGKTVFCNCDDPRLSNFFTTFPITSKLSACVDSSQHATKTAMQISSVKAQANRLCG